MSRAVALLTLVAWLVVPGVAEACSVCFSTTEENQWAFIATTVFLSVAPLALLFAVGSWLRRKVLESEQRHDGARRRA
ncbi:MAG: hypothetical protein HKP30_03200 [Myxococcales bacterium]|nr:hypothetical protein [Myxococcales bacterium]